MELVTNELNEVQSQTKYNKILINMSEFLKVVKIFWDILLQSQHCLKRTTSECEWTLLSAGTLCRLRCVIPQLRNCLVTWKPTVFYSESFHNHPHEQISKQCS